MTDENANSAAAVRDVLRPAHSSEVHVGGHLGRMMDLDIRNRVMAQDIQKLIQPFRDQTEIGDGDWRCEYWGKWFTSAVLACEYHPTIQNRQIVERAVRELLATQGPDGYIGTRRKQYRLLGWDVWGRKYVLLGLLAYYDLAKDARVLAAARRHADTLLAECGPGKANIAEVGYAGWKGLPPSSVLEPMVLLYRRTHDPRYLAFARYIVAQWSKPSKLSPNGLRLVEQALSRTPVRQIDAPKAYEMMSCYEGLCELYRVIGDPAYLTALRNIAANIIHDELFIVGSGSSREVWFGGRTKQLEDNPDPMETCVTVTWMKLCYQLLRLTGDPLYADQMETSLYNALLGALKPDGSWWCYYTPLRGTKRPSHVQHADVGLSCCVTNGPRALLLTPRWAVMTGGNAVVVNLFCPMTAAVSLPSGNRVTIVQDTRYPETGRVRITVSPEHPEEFSLRLRIPAWSEKTVLRVNGGTPRAQVPAGAYAPITRTWAKGDVVLLDLDMRGRVVKDPAGSSAVAVMRGPIVLAWDQRLGAPEGQNLVLRQDAAGRIALRAAKPPVGEDIWMVFTAPCTDAAGKEVELALCDYASAGDTWDARSRFRVWLEQPLNLAAAPGLDAAQWIWFPGDPGDPRQEVPSGTRYFRAAWHGLDERVEEAVIRITADDAFVLYVNGVEIGRGDAWQQAHTFQIGSVLRPGANVIAVEVTNSTPSPAGLVAAAEARMPDGRVQRFVTDGAWKSSSTPTEGWAKADFDDAAWAPAKIVGSFGCSPWGYVE
ncbi:MAG: beta-L-arabinofuranosidase domain-containing protein [Chthonomonadales bacterium]